MEPANSKEAALTYRRTYDPVKREQVFATLRREILAARLKVTLDEQLGRLTASLERKTQGRDLAVSTGS